MNYLRKIFIRKEKKKKKQLKFLTNFFLFFIKVVSKLSLNNLLTNALRVPIDH